MSRVLGRTEAFIKILFLSHLLCFILLYSFIGCKSTHFLSPFVDRPNAYGREIRVHGFLQREVREMKRLVEER